jgi:hypothetical protein
VHDYLQVIFSDGTILNVYNSFRYDGDSVYDIVGTTLENVLVTDEEAVFLFKGNGRLVVGLRADDYNGPEAMEFARRGEPTIIW